MTSHAPAAAFAGAETAAPSLLVEREPLLSALELVCRVVERRNTIPVLSNVLLTPSDGGGLTLRATDLDIQCELDVDAAALNAFQPAVVAQLLLYLGFVRTAVELAESTLSMCAETMPDQDEDQCEALALVESSAQEMTEALWFLDQVRLVLPPSDPPTVSDLKALADARLASRRTLTAAELATVGMAVQWAGHLAMLEGTCQSGGPAFSSVADATRIIEAAGFPIPHGGAVRAMIQPEGDSN